jgi:hypothetical protein
MRKKQEEKEKVEVPDLSCCVCIYRKECGQAEENKFCGKFESRKFKPDKEPNQIWEAYQKDRFKKGNKNEKNV